MRGELSVRWSATSARINRPQALPLASATLRETKGAVCSVFLQRLTCSPEDVCPASRSGRRPPRTRPRPATREAARFTTKWRGDPIDPRHGCSLSARGKPRRAPTGLAGIAILDGATCQQPVVPRGMGRAYRCGLALAPAISRRRPAPRLLLASLRASLPGERSLLRSSTTPLASVRSAVPPRAYSQRNPACCRFARKPALRAAPDIKGYV